MKTTRSDTRLKRFEDFPRRSYESTSITSSPSPESPRLPLEVRLELMDYFETVEPKEAFSVKKWLKSHKRSLIGWIGGVAFCGFICLILIKRHGLIAHLLKII